VTLVVTNNQDGTTSLTIDFIDEGVDLQCETTVKGGEAAAYTYLPFFEKDMRRNFADRWPLPEPTTPEMPEGGI
jgi:hypothetical protein